MKKSRPWFLPASVLVAILVVPGLSARGQAENEPPARSPAGGAGAGAAVPDRNPGYLLVVAPARQVHADLTMEVEAPRLSASEWIVYGAELPVLPGQTGVSSTLEPLGEHGRERSNAHRPVLRARIPVQNTGQPTTLSIHIAYEATLWSRRLERVTAQPEREARPLIPPLDPAERRLATARGGLFDVASDGFQRWMNEQQLRREAEEGAIDFARRVFRAIRGGFTYAYSPTMDRHASRVCRAGAGDCGALSVVFVTALRARGIPARLLVGRWAQSGVGERDGSAYDQQHVKSEFYAEGVGWVPVDVSSGLVHDRSSEGLRHFGNDPGDFLTLHVDANLSCDTILFGRKVVEWMQSPSLWAAGAGTFDKMTKRETWVVKTAPPPALVEASFNTQPLPEPAKEKEKPQPQRKGAAVQRR